MWIGNLIHFRYGRVGYLPIADTGPDGMRLKAAATPGIAAPRVPVAGYGVGSRTAATAAASSAVATVSSP